MEISPDLDGIVAENSATCFSSGVSARMVSTSSWKPIRSISSASSSTRNRRADRSRVPLLQVVDDPPRRADDNLGAAAQPRQLQAIGLAAVNRQHLKPGR